MTIERQLIIQKLKAPVAQIEERSTCFFHLPKLIFVAGMQLYKY